MSDDKPDTTTMTGAEFQRHAGTDPAKWAEAFLRAYATADGLHTDADRQAFVEAWCRHIADAVRHEHTALGRLVPRHDE